MFKMKEIKNNQNLKISKLYLYLENRKIRIKLIKISAIPSIQKGLCKIIQGKRCGPNQLRK